MWSSRSRKWRGWGKQREAYNGDDVMGNHRRDNARGGQKFNARGSQEWAPIDSDRRLGRRKRQPSTTTTVQCEGPTRVGTHRQKSHARGRQELAPIDSDRQLERREGQPSTTTTREEDNSPVRGAHKSGHPLTKVACEGPTRVGTHRRRQDDWDDSKSIRNLVKQGDCSVPTGTTIQIRARKKLCTTSMTGIIVLTTMSVTNPFDFMDVISLQGKTSFFEKRVSDYSKANTSPTQRWKQPRARLSHWTRTSKLFTGMFAQQHNANASVVRARPSLRRRRGQRRFPEPSAAHWRKCGHTRSAADQNANGVSPAAASSQGDNAWNPVQPAGANAGTREGRGAVDENANGVSLAVTVASREKNSPKTQVDTRQPHNKPESPYPSKTVPSHQKQSRRLRISPVALKYMNIQNWRCTSRPRTHLPITQQPTSLARKSHPPEHVAPIDADENQETGRGIAIEYVESGPVGYRPQTLGSVSDTQPSAPKPTKGRPRHHEASSAKYARRPRELPNRDIAQT
ncbi:hypothetical protein BU15DRAFT_57819 [Melanogaster broomeanus]|nr:hypothetical protein BU15DRAFT_57819 [Melanogaster broomeanus]